MTTIERSYPAPAIGRSALVRLWVLAGALFVVGTNAFVIAGVLPDLARDFGTSTSAVASAITWYAAVVAVASPLVATLLARVPRRALLTVGMALVAVGVGVTAIADTNGTFVAGRVVAALGGATLVPPATAAAPALVDPEHRGRAIAVVTSGFAAAVAVGSPLGTALAAAVGWRATLGGVAGLAVALAATIALTVTGVPTSVGATLRARVRVLADRRIHLALLAMVCCTLSFNVLYVFSAEVLAPALGDSPGLLAVPLLAFGLASLLGTWLGGRLVDRTSGLRTTVVGIAGMVLAYGALVGVAGTLPAATAVYALWGVVTMLPQVGIQDLLVVADPREAGVSLSWYSTAMYVGIALAPVLGGMALGAGRTVVPLAALAAAVVALACVLGARGRVSAEPA